MPQTKWWFLKFPCSQMSSESLANDNYTEEVDEESGIKFYTTKASSHLDEQDILRQRKKIKLGLQVGAGGYGIVYKAEIAGDPREYAAKVINLNECLRRHFRNELMVMRKCQDNKHPNLIEMVDTFVINFKAYIIMEYANSGTIAEQIANNNPLSEDTAKMYFKQIVDGLVDGLHKNMIAHRDLKLENILLTKSYGRTTVKITDFGLAIAAYHARRGYIESGNFAGTRPYMAPELIRIRVYHEFRGEFCFDFNPFLADIYALGVCLFEMLTARLPFPSKIDEELLRIQNDREYSIPIHCMVSEQCKNLLDQLLEPNVDLRLDPFGIKQHPWLLDSRRTNN